MARPRDEERRRRLRAGACDYLLRVGVSAADLGEVAREVGTSARMLVHYFGSKDELIADAIGEARAQQRALFRDWFEAREDRTVAGLLRSLRELMQTPQARPYLLLFSEVYALTVQQPERFPGFTTSAAVHDWLPTLESALRAGGDDDDDEARAQATLVLAIQRGLLLDELGTADHERVQSAHEALLRLLDCGSATRGTHDHDFHPHPPQAS
jgi:AcrR family transcriptional regulator